ncbi:esterase [Sporothrix brasiliensis 5110]|uniref:Esterase n=1 Tax=Sporothrix brasiliensis 5110 TaxID=1398154 RepID=A0A0C2IZ56_9PEZI|nr:esterase [Sporothrix brasiliensis 5110]KIH90257.1 esterase [Sporothrix brasiliensis 5110]
MALSECCVKSFVWEGTPEGRVGKIAGGQYNAYIAGKSSSAAVLFIHDVYGWENPNARLMADHYARQTGVTVYVPDFFHGEVLRRSDHPELADAEFLKQHVLPFVGRHPRDARDKDVFTVARALRREHGHDRLAAIGFCYGGWAVMRLGAKPEDQPEDEDKDAKPIEGPLVQAVSTAHPSLVTERDLAGVAVPLQILAPEIDQLYTPALKQFTFDVTAKNGIPLDYLHFPGVAHGSLMRSNQKSPEARKVVERAQHAAINFFKLNLGLIH